MAPERDPNSDQPIERLPRGRHKLSRDTIEASQRGRVIRALIEEVAEKGYAATSIGSVVARAAVSRQTFYEHFDNKQRAFRTARDVAMGEPFAQLLRALDSSGSVAQAGEAVSQFIRAVLSDEPAARCFVLDGPPEWMSGTSRSAARRRAAMSLQQHLDLPELLPCIAYSATVDALLHDALSSGELDPSRRASEAVRILNLLVEGYRKDTGTGDPEDTSAPDDPGDVFALLVAAEDRRQAARAALHGWVRALDVFAGCADLLLPDQKALRAVAYVCAGSDDEHLRDEEYALDDYPSTAEALSSGQPYSCRIDDPQADAAEVRLLKERGYASLLLVPLVSDSGPIGIIELFDIRPRTFTDLERRTAQLLAAHAAALLRQLPSAQLV